MVGQDWKWRSTLCYEGHECLSEEFVPISLSSGELPKAFEQDNDIIRAAIMRLIYQQYVGQTETGKSGDRDNG